MIGEPLSWIKVSNEFDELKDLMKTWKEDQYALLFVIEIVFESVLSFNNVANENRRDSHDSFLDRRFI